MCSRYTLTHNREKIIKRFGVKMADNWKPRYNIAPSQEMIVITNASPDKASLFRWGFIPNWSNDEKVGFTMFNARAENILSKALFRESIRSKRCLIPADGFYEWKKSGKNKTPYRVTLSSDEAFSFAGIWDSWERKDGEIINTYSIITTTANELMQELNDRMPVILPKDLEKDWLRQDLKDNDISDMMRQYDSSKMTFYEAHKNVNKTDYDTLECIQVAPKIYPGETYHLFE
jgi:putative SOS response-associated peptidase YedK